MSWTALRRPMVALALLVSTTPASAADESPKKPAPFWADYTGNSLGGSVVGRDGVWSAAASYTWNRRSDIGVVHTSSRVQLGLAGNGIGVGGFGEAGVLVGASVLRSHPWGLVFAGGPAVELSVLPGSDAHLGVNVLSLAQVERREEGLAHGLAFSLVVSVPSHLGGDDRLEPWFTLNVGYNAPTRLTQAKASRAAAKSAPPARPAAATTTAAPVSTPADGAVAPATRQREVKLDEERCVFDLSRPILFGDNSVEPLAESGSLLDDFAALMAEHPQIELVRLEGHTDSRGSTAYNRTLSTWRVEAVIDALVARGVARERLVGVGFGEDQPVVAEARTEEQHAQNRRVIFRIVRGPRCRAD